MALERGAPEIGAPALDGGLFNRGKIADLFGAELSNAALLEAIKALAFFRPDQPGKRAAEDLLKQYASRSDGKFTWEIVDADRQPLVARKYNVESYGTVVLETTLADGDAVSIIPAVSGG